VDWLDLIFPKKCVGCGKWGKYVCEECEVGMWEEEQICPGCCRSSRYGLRHEYCRNKGYLDGVSCLWAYEGLVRRLISGAKYKLYFDYLGELFKDVNERSEYYSLVKFLKVQPVVVPVPLFFKREKERGFNQAEVIGRWISREWKLELTNLLVRIKDTGKQVGRNREERLKAMEGAFQIRFKIQDSKFKMPAKVLLIDDVWTTGTTVQECAKTLKKAGVKEVWGWVLAR
jgi:competence protein ComFC